MPIARTYGFGLILICFGVFLALQSPVMAFAQINSEVSVFNDSFISSAFQAADKSNFQFIGTQFKSAPNSTDSFKMDVAAGLAVGSPLLNYINVSELYFESNQGNGQAFYIGRKKFDWSALDSRWNLGVFEPIFSWDPLTPSSQGLTGLFWQVEHPWWNILVFASPFYIPDQGPSFEVENGSFVKGNPWFRTPPSDINIFGQTTQIDYQYDKPNDASVVMQKSFGGKVGIGDTKDGLSAQASYIYKPANQLAIGYNGTLDIPSDAGVVTLLPEVYYHSLTGLDIKYQASRSVRMGISSLYDHPSQEQVFDSQWTYPVFQDAVLVSPYIDWASPIGIFSLQYLNISGGNVTEVGDLASNTRAALSDPYPYREAIQASFANKFYFGQNRILSSKLTYTISQLNKFSMIRLESRLHLSKIWSFFIDGQLVDAAPETFSNQNIIAEYANNDQLMIGVAYAF